MSVVWLLGLPGSGKSTLAEALRRVVSSAAPVAVLDGDALQAALDGDAGPGLEDAVARTARLGRLARLLASQRLVVVVTDTCSDAERLAWNRAHLPGYRQIVLTASTPVLERRDVHGAYVRARQRGATADRFLGEGFDWHEPADSELVIAMDDPEPPEVLALRAAMLIPEYVAAATAVARTPPGRLGPPVRIR